MQRLSNFADCHKCVGSNLFDLQRLFLVSAHLPRSSLSIGRATCAGSRSAAFKISITLAAFWQSFMRRTCRYSEFCAFQGRLGNGSSNSR